ncbi:Wzz/FepE/Etk N-terminal domain-containing protein [Gammaproteobacteria bacterium]|nr:Wzz/FepE/Etk N-terminal domain-containing protein [Gammaproteobacteria bacterium]
MNNNNTNSDREIDLRDVFVLLWNKKFLLLLLTSTFATFSVIYALSLPNIYSSEALLAPATEESSLSSKVGQFSGIGLPGFNISNQSNTNTKEAIERMKSFDFFKTYFLPNIQLENLMAVVSWNAKDNTLMYNENLFNEESRKWIRDVSFPKKTIPSEQEAYNEIYKEIFTVNLNKNSGFISLSIKHKSPYIAKKWLDIIILNINESMRELDKKNAQNSINFLNDSIKSTSLKSITDVISVLLENQMQTLMLAHSQDDYVFKVIESPFVAEKKSEPSRSKICILITFMGFVFSVILIFLLEYIKSNKHRSMLRL